MDIEQLINEANNFISQHKYTDARKTLDKDIIKTRIILLEQEPQKADLQDLDMLRCASELAFIQGDVDKTSHLCNIGAIIARKLNNPDNFAEKMHALAALSALESKRFSKADEHLRNINSELLCWIKEFQIDKIHGIVTSNIARMMIYRAIASLFASRGNLAKAQICIRHARTAVNYFEWKNTNLWNVLLLRFIFRKSKLRVLLDLDQAYYHLQCGEAKRAENLLDIYQRNNLFKQDPLLGLQAEILLARAAFLNRRLGACKSRLLSIATKLLHSPDNITTVEFMITQCAWYLIELNQINTVSNLVSKIKAAYRSNKIPINKRISNEITYIEQYISSYRAYANLALVFGFQPDNKGREKNTMEISQEIGTSFAYRLLHSYRQLQIGSQLQLEHSINDQYIMKIDSPLIKGQLQLFQVISALKTETDFDLAQKYLNEAIRNLKSCDAPMELWYALTLASIIYQKLGDNQKAYKMSKTSRRLLKQLTSSLSPEDRDIFLLDKYQIVQEIYVDMEIQKLQQWDRWCENASPTFKWFYRSRSMWQAMKLLLQSGIPNAPRKQPNDNNTHWILSLLFSEIHFQLKLKLSNFLHYLFKWPQFKVEDSISKYAIVGLIHGNNYILTVYLVLKKLKLMWYVSDVTYADFDENYRILLERLNKFGSLDTDKGVHKNLINNHVDCVNNASESITEKLNFHKLIPELNNYAIKELQIIADGIFRLIPLSALYYDKKYLCEHFNIVQLVRGTKKQQHLKNYKYALVVDIGQGKGVRELQGATKEGDKIFNYMKKFIDNVYRQSSSQNKSSFRKLLIRKLFTLANLIHFAGHAEFNQYNPFASGLMITREDVITIEEISQWNLNEVIHISTTACSSAETMGVSRQWTIGLPEAFISAGAHMVLGALWVIPDRFSSEIMPLYYEGLGKKITSKNCIEQINNLKRNIITGKSLSNENPSWRHPFYWASLNFYLSI